MQTPPCGPRGRLLAPPGQVARLHVTGPDGEDEDEDVEEQQSVINGIFGVRGLDGRGVVGSACAV